ncbi:helix-turn-helix transcriptional regulator [Rhizobium metallidurans]|uniref:PAS domain S-box-containing protein n=1 Tax=Rhizobium metallidurans TaxID=1265931 RepID=A0A7W6GDK9_9HYPH|nr:LuxR C-terminal-related transcriptional regulator [Rhizobium metallidurans]MBB3967302.1 PAS domain S-box-containing protein [Rhizobium metallidurans]
MNSDNVRNRFFLDDIPVPMVLANYRIIRDCNSAFLGLFGYAREELIDRSFANLYPQKADFARIGQIWGAHLAEGIVYRDERVMTASNGRRFWCQVHGRAKNAQTPFAQALYCFQPISRPVEIEKLHLTSRQKQIVALVAQGKTNADIAAELSLSVRTIESHRARLMKAAGIKNAAHLAAAFGANVE